ncbi:hypothetical protein HYH02_014182 [Chlamydomonas schloesseri]|uniref:BTB domain-containing protein n=1 Tax=Chlamydomonas schloesseri TaxID=2026947 RepID=A0A835VXZ0_9CHLO|nr:hypothetical protein HYH02_014182 [Chlamydomonas schloesseri]|eukprot:KAG2429146.1 hypothetical protein HYH02_014182 [Chlamydomonas schloesseri]
MDRLFLSGLLGRKKEPPALTVDANSPSGGRASPSPGASPASQQHLYGGVCGGGGGTATLYSSSAAAALAIAGSGGGSTTTGSILSALYGGRPPEQLLLDAASCDLVLLVADEVTVTRAVPVHKEVRRAAGDDVEVCRVQVLRARNPGGYFARLLADPGSFPEYSEGGSAPASGGAVITGHLVGKPIIRRTQWAWPMASALLGFMYRDVCEVTWAQLPAVRLAAEEIGLRGLVEAVDYLLDAQHLLPWTAADLRAAAAALRRHQLVEAADRYMAACRAAGVDENTRLANFVYHARQPRQKFASAIPASPAGAGHHSPAGGGGGGGGGGALPVIPGASASSTASGGAPDEDVAWSGRYGGGGGACGGGGGCLASGQLQHFRDTRLGLDLIDGVLRSVALDSRVLRGLLLPGRRKDYVLLAGAAANSGAGLGSAMGLAGGGAAGGGGPPGVGGMGHSRARRLSSLMVGSGSNVSPAHGLASSPAGGVLVSPPGGALRPSSPFGGHGSGAASPGPGQGRPQTPSRASLELPLLGSRIRTIMATSPAAGGTQGGGGGGTQGGGVEGAGGSGLSPTRISGSAGHPFGPGTAGGGGGGGGDQQQDRLDPWDALELMVMVPAARLTAALTTVVERQLDAHAPQPLAGPAAAKKAQEDAAASFNPFSRLTGVPGLGWGRDGSGGAGSPVSGGGGVGGGGVNLALSSSLFAPTSSSTAPPSPSPGMPHRAGSGHSHLHGSSSASALASAAAAAAASHYAGLPTSLHAQLQQPLQQQPAALQLLPAASSLGQQDQLSLALALDMGVGSGGAGGADPAAAAAAAAAARLLGSVLTTLAAMEQAHFTVRLDATAVSQAVAFERRRASMDISTNQLNGLAGIGGGGGGHGGGGGGAGGSKGVMGPASPREYFIPLPEHPSSAITITLPLGLVLVDSAVLDAVNSGAGGMHSAGGGGGGGGGEDDTDGGSRRSSLDVRPGARHSIDRNPSNGRSHYTQGSAADKASEGGSVHGGGGGGGSVHGGSVCGAGGPGGGGGTSSARVAALMPHLLGSAAALSQLISAVALVTQVLRVAGEQHGVFVTPPMRASLRVSNPSASLLSVLCQTNTYFAVEPHRNTLYVRKPPADILRLLQALHSTLPMKSRGSNSSMAPSTTFTGSGGAPGTPHLGLGLDMGVSVVAASRGPPGHHGHGPSSSYSPSSMRARSSIDHGAPGAGGLRPGTPSNPLPLAAFMNASGSNPGGAGVGAGAPRRGSLDLSRHSAGSPFGGGGGGPGHSGLGPGAGGGGYSYTSGTPYGQLERLFPGWHMHIVELAPPGVMVEEF